MTTSQTDDMYCIRLHRKEKRMRFIPVDYLHGNEIIAVNIINANLQILIRKGTTLTHKMIERIKIYGIQSVYIEDKTMSQFLYSDISDTIKPELRSTSIHLLKSAFDTFEKKVTLQKKSLKYGDVGQLLFKQIKHTSGELIKEVMKSKQHIVTMNDIKSISSYHLEHSVNVAVLSLIIGAELGLNSDALEALTFGALLIDIGTKWIDQKLLLKVDKLSTGEMKSIQEHVNYGYQYITDNTTFNAHVKSILMHHHERMNGSGYPKQLKEEAIHPLSKIIMIADVYDALTSDHTYRKAYNQHEAIEYIMGNAGTLFDFRIANIFARKVIPYPVGSYVLLSNNQKGVVITNNPNHPLRPVVRTFGESTYTMESSYQVNLLEVKNIVIDKIIYKLQ